MFLFIYYENEENVTRKVCNIIHHIPPDQWAGGLIGWQVVTVDVLSFIIYPIMDIFFCVLVI